MSKAVLIKVDGISKKFARQMRYVLLYGIRDLLVTTLWGSKSAFNKLRPNEFWALRDINLDLHENEILAVVGTNGSGKTTLMRLLANIYAPDAGRIVHHPDLRVSAIFALGAGMEPLFTGWENAEIRAGMYGMDAETLRKSKDFIANFSELGDRLDAPLGNYSSGMKARLGYSVAVATDPDVFIIDEALSVGDSAFKAKCLRYLRQFVARPGKGVLFVSNNIRKVLKIADRVIVLDRGRVVHESQDVIGALRFYVANSVKHLPERERKTMIREIERFDM